MLRIIFALGVVDLCISAPQWDYGAKGPPTWGDSFGDCIESAQSPINIVTDDALIDPRLRSVNRTLFFHPPAAMTISNNGHSLVATFVDGAYEIDDDGLLPFTARIAQYHFHWAVNAQSGGSEHTLNGKQFFGELHAVHYNVKYNSISEAADKPDGLAVFGWFISADYPQDNQDFELFLKLAANGAPRFGDSVQVQRPFSLETLLPADMNKYYRYRGSLTTPMCFESVTWTVFEDPIRISQMQASGLCDLFSDSTNSTLRGNFRPPQPLKGRVVTKPPALFLSPADSYCYNL